MTNSPVIFQRTQIQIDLTECIQAQAKFLKLDQMNLYHRRCIRLFRINSDSESTPKYNEELLHTDWKYLEGQLNETINPNRRKWRYLK